MIFFGKFCRFLQKILQKVDISWYFVTMLGECTRKWYISIFLHFPIHVLHINASDFEIIPQRSNKCNKCNKHNEISGKSGGNIKNHDFSFSSQKQSQTVWRAQEPPRGVLSGSCDAPKTFPTPHQWQVYDSVVFVPAQPQNLVFRNPARMSPKYRCQIYGTARTPGYPRFSVNFFSRWNL